MAGRRDNVKEGIIGVPNEGDERVSGMFRVGADWAQLERVWGSRGKQRQDGRLGDKKVGQVL
jgi:hypothetical protein